MWPLRFVVLLLCVGCSQQFLYSTQAVEMQVAQLSIRLSPVSVHPKDSLSVEVLLRNTSLRPFSVCGDIDLSVISLCHYELQLRTNVNDEFRTIMQYSRDF